MLCNVVIVVVVVVVVAVVVVAVVVVVVVVVAVVVIVLVDNYKGSSKCASRHNGVHFFNISTSKSGPSMVCFVHFDFEMCFAPQRRALFRHLNFQKWSETVSFLHF